MYLLFDRVCETSTTTGTGNFTLAGAKTGFRSFSIVGNGNPCTYAATNNVDWETGFGTWSSSGTTLSRTVLASSNAGAAVNWGAGSKDVFLTATAFWLESLCPLTTKGDLVTYSSALNNTRFAVGANTKVLTADSAEGVGLKWEYPKVVQVVHTVMSSGVTGTTVIPYDDTIPQITEGVSALLGTTITPKATTNKLLIQVVTCAAHSAGGRICTALFQDATSSALACVDTLGTAADEEVNTLHHYMTAGTTSATTFSVRVGCHNAGTTTINGSGGNRKYGGVMSSTVTITEFLP